VQEKNNKLKNKIMKLTKINLDDNLTQKEMGKLVGGVNETTQTTSGGSIVIGGDKRTYSSDTEYGYMDLPAGADPTKASNWKFVRTSTTYCFNDDGGGGTCPDGTGFDDGTDFGGGAGVGGTGF
jgi:hypothetical protein